MSSERQTVRIAAIADIHYKRGSQGSLAPLLGEINAKADILLICGDFTDLGLPEEAEIAARDIVTTVRKPVLAVLGNHDFESGKADEVADILKNAGVIVLDGDTVEVQGIGFAGVKGFAGGFGRWSLAPWGEDSIKAFVRESVDEALRLESALAKLRQEQKIVLLHYAPIRDTVVGEPEEILPFLGSSRLEEPLNRYGVGAAFHGHAHHGSAEGRTTAGVPVYNVSLPALQRAYPDRPPFCLIEVARPQNVDEPAEAEEERIAFRSRNQ